jgi:hypothetical protein
MSTQTRERNYRKNPHTARFLQTFHSANGTNNTAEAHAAEDQATIRAAMEAGTAFAPAFTQVKAETVPAYQPSDAQVALISKLVLEINALDANLGEQAASYTGRMDREGLWTRENTSRWISNLIKKSRELRAAKTPATPAEVADGRYAVEEDGVLKFFKVKNGRRPGFIFLDIQASDEWHSVRNVTRISSVLALIAVDAKAAMIRYGQELGECGHCGRTLTDAASRAAGIGPICQGK